MIAGYVRRFGAEYAAKVGVWKERLSEWKKKNAKVAIWGGGSKGVTFLNVLRPGPTVGCMVDINPRKQGMFVAGTGQQIVAPEHLKAYNPDVVVIMNPVYREEIRGLLSNLGLAPALELA